MNLPSLWRSGLHCPYLLSDTFAENKVLFLPQKRESNGKWEHVYLYPYIFTNTIAQWSSSQNAHGTAHLCPFADTERQQCECFTHSDKILKWIHKQKEYGVLIKYLGDAATFNLLIPLETGHLYLHQPANSNPIFKASLLIFRMQVYILQQQCQLNVTYYQNN